MVRKIIFLHCVKHNFRYPTYSQVKFHIGMKLRVRAFWSCNICLPESARFKDMSSFWNSVCSFLVRFVDKRQLMSNIFIKLTKCGM